MKVSVIGTPSCGRTVFLGLLYETLIRMSTSEDGGPSEVIVNAGPVEAKVLGDLRLELLSGRWPSDDLGSKVAGCALELGFRSDSRYFLRSRGIRKVQLENVPLSEKDLRVMRDAGQLKEVRQGSSGGTIDRYGLSEGFRDSLDSEALILLAGVSRTAQEDSWPIEERDAFLATIVDNASRTRLGKERKAGFLVVLTKAQRAETDHQQIFEEMFPRTAGALRRAIPNGDVSAHIFISWMVTVQDRSGLQVPATAMADGQVQIDYSEKEYRKLVGLVGEMSR